MRALAILTGLIMLCVLCWVIASVLSPDVIPLAVMMLFGLLAGIPTALLMLAAGRHRVREDDDEPELDDYSPMMVIYTPPPPPQYSDISHVLNDDPYPALPAYNATPRRLALPVNDEAERVRRLAKRGKLSKMPADFDGETPAGYRRITRNTDDGRFEREELNESWMES